MTKLDQREKEIRYLKYLEIQTLKQARQIIKNYNRELREIEKIKSKRR